MQESTVEQEHLSALIAMQGSTVEPQEQLHALIAAGKYSGAAASVCSDCDAGKYSGALHLSALIAVQGSTAQQLGPQVNPPALCALLEHLLLLAL